MLVRFRSDVVVKTKVEEFFLIRKEGLVGEINVPCAGSLVSDCSTVQVDKSLLVGLAMLVYNFYECSV